MKILRHPLRRFVLALAASAMLASCGGGFFEDASDGEVRLLNASTEFANGLDLYDGTEGIVAGVASYTVSGYEHRESGDATFNLKANGSSVTSATVNGNLAKGDKATLVAYVDGGALKAQLLSDEEGEPGSDRAKLRIFHAAPTDTGNVDVYLIDGECSTLAGNIAAAFATNVSGLQETYTETNAGTYHVCVTAAGDRGNVRLDIPAFALASRQVTTLVLVHTAGGTLLNGLRLDQAGALTPLLSTTARVRVAASLAGGGTVSATVNEVVVAANQAAATVGAYRAVTAGALTVTVNGAPVTVAGLSSLSPGADATLLVTDTGTATLLADDNAASTSTAQPVKLRLVNGLNGTNGTMTLTLDNNIVADAVPFKGASAPTLVAASSADASLVAQDAGGTVATLANATLTTGGSYTAFVLGDRPATPGTIVLVRGRP